jgi:putative spermidine/putrescine transport system ATP-binding protein
VSRNIEFSGVSKSFGRTVALADFSVIVQEGELVTLLGPSGCGKSTALRIAAGFETPDSGDVTIGGASMLGLAPNKRGIGMVFQNYSLFPHLTVRENLEFAMRVRRMARAARDERVGQLLDLVRLAGLESRYPHQMSGGQQQRVALARALAAQPQVLLLDEPLSALDATVRVEVREEIRRIQREAGIATLFVTHDQEEALAISDRICVMRDGKVEQVGTPLAVYRFPSSVFVARFVGKINEIHIDLRSSTTARLHGHAVEVGIPTTTLGGGEARLLVRPEDIRLVTVGEPGAIRGTVSDVHFGGATTTVGVAIAGTRQSLRIADVTRAITHGVGDEVGVLLDTQRALVTRE